MDPLRRKSDPWKIILRKLPYCFLLFLLLTSVAVIRNKFYSTKANFYLSRLENQVSFVYTLSSTCGDLGPEEFVPCNKLVTKPDKYYYMVFQRLLKEGYLSPLSKALCIGSTRDEDMIGLRKAGLTDVIGVYESSTGQVFDHSVDNNTFDFEFFGYSSRLNWSVRHSAIASEIGRTLKVGGYLVVHTAVKDEYSYNSFIDLFTCYRIVGLRAIRGLENSVPSLQEVILKREDQYSSLAAPSKCIAPPAQKKTSE